MARGFFITFEGGEGTGKSTQAARLVDRLKATGREVVATREPGGTPGAEAIRALLVRGAADRWSPVSETLLMNAARRDHIERVIAPALERGAVVVCDRFADSTRAYQGVAGGAPSGLVEALETAVLGETRPDLTLIFDLAPQAGLARAAGRAGGETRFEAKGAAFHEALRAAFVAIARARAAAVRGDRRSAGCGERGAGGVGGGVAEAGRPWLRRRHTRARCSTIWAARPWRAPLSTRSRGDGCITPGCSRVPRASARRPSPIARPAACWAPRRPRAMAPWAPRRRIRFRDRSSPALTPTCWPCSGTREDGKTRKGIPVDEARTLPEFFAKSPATAPYRVAIIDTADDLNASAANAVLKTLEEPPERGVLLLISNAPGALLPTLRSRCRRLRFSPPATDVARPWVTARTGLDIESALRLLRMARGAPGRAWRLATQDALAADDTAREMLDRLPRVDEMAMLALSDSFRGAAGAARFDLLFERLADHVHERVSRRAMDGGQEAGEGRAQDAWAEIWDLLNTLPRQVEAVNLDRADAFFTALSRLRAIA